MVCMSVMLRWLPVLLVAWLVQKTTALTQVATPRGNNFAVHEIDQRTALHSGQTTVEIDRLGRVNLLHRRDPKVITYVSDSTVYGSLVLFTVNAEVFSRDPDALNAARQGVEQVVKALQLASTDISASLVWLEDLPQAVRVDFQVAFVNQGQRQVFTSKVVTDGGRQLAKGICDGVPGRFKRHCLLPGAAVLQQQYDHDHLSLAGLDLEEKEEEDAQKAAGAELLANPRCYGNISITPQGSAKLFVADLEWQEAVAMAIALTARVSRLQVGTLMAVVSNAVRVDFWLARGRATCSKVAVRRVMTRNLSSTVDWQMQRWLLSNEGSKDSVLYGRMVLQVPKPRFFATSRSVAEAVESAVARAAAAPSPEVKLSLRKVAVSLAAVDNSSDALRVGFRIAFGNPRDRQVFSEEIADDGGEKLAKTINGRVSACEGRCRLPGRRQEKATLGDTEPDGLYVVTKVYVWKPQQLASDPLVQDAMAMAISQIASVPRQQVGTLLTAEFGILVRIHFWVASREKTLRQAAVERMELAGLPKFFRCTLAHLDRLHHEEVGSSDSANVIAHGSFMLHVPEPPRFSDNPVARRAIGSAIMQVAAVPGQVRWLVVRSGLWDDYPQLVRVDFRVTLGSRGHAKNFTRALAVDGSEKLLQSINELLPEPFKGKCRLPVMDQLKARTAVTHTTRKSNGQRAASTLRSVRNAASFKEQPFGTMWFNAFSPTSVVGNEALPRTIAGVASLPRPQVAVIATLQSQVLLSVDFWVMSTNATLRQAAVQRVNKEWTDEDMRAAWGLSNVYPAFLINGGTVFNGADRFTC